MKRILLSLFLLLATVALLFGQRTHWDIVSLKSGKVYRGTIVELNPKNNVSIYTEDGELLTFAMIEVTKITTTKKELADNPAIVKNRSTDEDYVHQGYSGSVEGGGLFALQVDETLPKDSINRLSYQLATVQGVHFSPNISGGLGLGIIFQEETTYFPLSLDFRTYFAPYARVKPYLRTAAGFSLLFQDPISSGHFFGDVDLGLKTFMTTSFGLTTSIGYHYRFYELHKEGGGAKVENSGFISVRLGLAF